MIGFVLLNWRGLAVGAGVAAIVAFPAGYIKGRTDGRVAQLQGAVDAYKNRKDIDHATASLGTYALCIELGGLPDECAKLRGLEQAPEGQKRGGAGIK